MFYTMQLCYDDDYDNLFKSKLTFFVKVCYQHDPVSIREGLGGHPEYILKNPRFTNLKENCNLGSW
jgi:hypothetical protein